MHFVIAGGVAVNDPKSNGSHDKFPYNFLNPAAKKAKSLAIGGGAVTVFVYEPAYVARALNQVDEHRTVDIGRLPCSAYEGRQDQLMCGVGVIDPPKNPQHFIQIIRDALTRVGATYVGIQSGQELADKLATAKNIEGIYYFGHSSDVQMFLEYSVTVTGSSTQTWGVPRAKRVAKDRFAKGAKLISYGCFQGEPDGLCDQLSRSSLWGIRCVGSLGKTNYGPIGLGKAYPSSNGGWVAYENGVQTQTTIEAE